MLSFQLEFESAELKSKLIKASEQAQRALDEQVVKDSNRYAPQQYSILMGSGLGNTTFGSGFVIWSTPYAARLYWNPQYRFSKDKNPNAGGLWFEVAKQNHLRDWLDIVGKQFPQG